MTRHRETPHGDSTGRQPRAMVAEARERQGRFVAPFRHDEADCTCGDTFNPRCPEHGGNEHRP